MLEKLKNFFAERPKMRRVVGITLIIIGGLSIITPFTPVGFLLIVGLEMAGIRFFFWDKLKEWHKKK